jgi:hypothetical protein
VISGGATISGGLTASGTINLNAGGLLTNTNINTGISTGTVTIGGGTAPLVINSTAFDVTATGAVSGVTTLNAGGQITTGTGITVGALTGKTVTCGNTNYLGGMQVVGGVIVGIDQCRGVGLSDARLKENIVSLDNSIVDRIKGVNTVNFDFKCDDPAFQTMHEACDAERQTGVIAQELASIFPELVYQDDYGYYRVKYDALNIYALKAVSEIAQHVDSQGNVMAATVTTGGTLRMTAEGMLDNITGLNLLSGGASIRGGLNNNGGGITNAGEVLGVTTLTAQGIILSGNGTQNLLTLQKDNTGIFTVFNNGALEIRLDAQNTFAIKNAAGNDYFSVNTQGGLVQVGGTNADDKAVLLVLDNINMDGDPAGINGAQYYNSKLNKFRCYQNDHWQDCLAPTYSEYTLLAERQSWNQPAADSEFPGSPRTWVDLSQANQIRLLTQLSSPGASTATCRLQYASSNNGPWKDISDSVAALSLSTSGALKGEWSNIATEASQEVLVRVMCAGGTFGTTASPIAIPEFSNIKLQVR